MNLARDPPWGIKLSLGGDSVPVPLAKGYRPLQSYALGTKVTLKVTF